MITTLYIALPDGLAWPDAAVEAVQMAKRLGLPGGTLSEAWGFEADGRMESTLRLEIAGPEADAVRELGRSLATAWGQRAVLAVGVEERTLELLGPHDPRCRVCGNGTFGAEVCGECRKEAEVCGECGLGRPAHGDPAVDHPFR